MEKIIVNSGGSIRNLDGSAISYTDYSHVTSETTKSAVTSVSSFLVVAVGPTVRIIDVLNNTTKIARVPGNIAWVTPVPGTDNVGLLVFKYTDYVLDSDLHQKINYTELNASGGVVISHNLTLPRRIAVSEGATSGEFQYNAYRFTILSRVVVDPTRRFVGFVGNQARTEDPGQDYLLINRTTGAIIPIVEQSPESLWHFGAVGMTFSDSGDRVLVDLSGMYSGIVTHAVDLPSGNLAPILNLQISFIEDGQTSSTHGRSGFANTVDIDKVYLAASNSSTVQLRDLSVPANEGIFIGSGNVALIRRGNSPVETLIRYGSNSYWRYTLPGTSSYGNIIDFYEPVAFDWWGTIVYRLPTTTVNCETPDGSPIVLSAVRNLRGSSLLSQKVPSFLSGIVSEVLSFDQNTVSLVMGTRQEMFLLIIPSDTSKQPKILRVTNDQDRSVTLVWENSDLKATNFSFIWDDRRLLPTSVNSDIPITYVGGTGLPDTVAQIAPNDSRYISTDGVGGMVFKLSPPLGGVNVGNTISIVMRAATTGNADTLITLLEGVVARGAWRISPWEVGPATEYLELTEPQKASIVNWDDLYIRVDIDVA